MASNQSENALTVFVPQAELVKRIDSIVPARPVDNLDELTNALETLRRQDLAFVLTPVARVDHVQALHQVSIRQVWIDPTVTKEQRGDYTMWKAGPHCYHNPAFMKEGEVALSKNGLMALLRAAGANPTTHRLDDGTRKHYSEYEALVYLQDLDGAWVQYPGHKTVDLSDGSAQATPMTPKQLQQARANVQENAETKAILRALRPVLGLQQVYKADDLRRKPFIIPKLVQHWDLSDPDQKRAAIAQSLGVGQRLFGPGGGGPPSLPEATRAQVAQPEEASNGSAPAPPPAQQGAATPPAAAAAETFNADDIPDFDKPAGVFCACPCSHEKEITPEVAEATKAKTGGVPRCQECYPSKQFNYEAHKNLTRLGMPRWPALTADDIRAQWQAAAAKKGGK